MIFTNEQLLAAARAIKEESLDGDKVRSDARAEVLALGHAPAVIAAAVASAREIAVTFMDGYLSHTEPQEVLVKVAKHVTGTIVASILLGAKLYEIAAAEAIAV